MRVTDQAIAAANNARVAVLAFRGGSGQPMALPVTPYVDGDRIIVTSTLAYIRKAELIRNDGRVAMLAGGMHVTGDAQVFADPDGNTFAERYLEQELAKYPPARALVEMPDHRKTLSWYFGRAIIAIEPRAAYEAFPAGDRCTATRIDASGYPSILTLAPKLHRLFEEAAAGDAIPVPLRDGPLVVLLHEESDDMSKLHQLTLRGDVRAGILRVDSRSGSLGDEPAPSIDYAARERRSRDIMRDWPAVSAASPN
jgi:hypothetical protein